MEIIEKNHTSLSKKDIMRSRASSDRLFFDTSVELLREGRGVKFEAPGDSMYPTICDGDLITVEPIKPSDVVVSDIILYRHENGVVAHRVVSIEAPQSSAPSPQRCFTFLGDAAINHDDPIRADQILGRVVSIERNGRQLDPYCLRIKLLYKARRVVARLKRLLFSTAI